MQPHCDSPKDSVRSCHRAVLFAACACTMVILLPGCGNVLYTYRAGEATSKIEEAKEAGAEKSATYEYVLAQEHLNKAMSEAAEADYGDAAELAELAEEYAQIAVDKAKRRMSAKPPSATAATTSSNSESRASLDTTLSNNAGEKK